jgi:hypothetical protein
MNKKFSQVMLNIIDPRPRVEKKNIMVYKHVQRAVGPWVQTVRMYERNDVIKQVWD